MVAAGFASTNDGAAHVVGWGVMGIGFPKLGFRFGELAVPGHLGVAHSELKLSKPEAFGCGRLVLGAGA